MLSQHSPAINRCSLQSTLPSILSNTFQCLQIVFKCTEDSRRKTMQVTIALRCSRIMNNAIPCRCFNHTPLAILNTTHAARPSNLNCILTGATSPSSHRWLWSSARTTPSVLMINSFLSDFPSRPPQNPGSPPNGYAMFSTEAKPAPKQEPATTLRKTGSFGGHVPDSKVIATPAKYLWTRANLEFRLPDSTYLALFASPATVLTGYGTARSGASAFNELRPGIFSKVALRTIWQVSRQNVNNFNNGVRVAAFSHFLRPHFASPMKATLQFRHFHSISDSDSPAPCAVAAAAAVGKPSLPLLQHSPEADSLCQVLIRHHNPFHHMESSLQLYGISLSPPLLHQTLLRLNHQSKIALAFFKYAQTYHHHPSSPPLLDTAAYNIIIDILCKVHQFDVAWQLILQMDSLKSDSKPDFTTFFILIRRLVSAGLTRTAIRTFYDMSIFLGTEVFDSQFSFCFCYLLDTLCKYGFVKVAVEVFNKEKYRVEPDTKLYTILIYGWCKVGRIEMGKRFFSEMLERGIEPNVVTYNVLLNGICRRVSLHPDGRFESVIREAEKVFNEMRANGLEPDITSYSILLHVYSRAHKPQLCLDKLVMMKEKGIWPSVATYTSVIKCLCSSGRMDDAENLLNEMVDYGVSPTAATYNCFFKEYRGRKDVDGAMKLYRRMKADSSLLSPDMHTHNILLGMFIKLGKMSLAWEVWDDMNASGIGPDLDAYTLLIHGLCEKRKWREACEFFMEMVEKGFLPQKITFETLYRGLIQADMLRTWRRLKKKLEEESVSFGSEFKEYHLKPYKR